MTTTYQPPTRRKKNNDRFNPDTFRVMGPDALETHPKFEPLPYTGSFEPEEAPFDPDMYKPQSKRCSFLRSDVHLLNEPICTVQTDHAEQHQWWPSRSNEGQVQKPNYTRDTQYRSDFYYTKDQTPQPKTRLQFTPRTEEARGIVPVTLLKEKSGKPRIYQEGVSFDNCHNRHKPKYIMKGKREGCFAYRRLDPEAEKRVMDEQARMKQEWQEKLAQEEREEKERQRLEAEAARVKAQPFVDWPQQTEPLRARFTLPPLTQQTEPQRTTTRFTLPPLESAQPRSPARSPPKATSPKMYPTVSSPLEWYDPKLKKPSSPKMYPTVSSPIECFDPERDQAERLAKALAKVESESKREESQATVDNSEEKDESECPWLCKNVVYL